jgi:hypothetical protein
MDGLFETHMAEIWGKAVHRPDHAPTALSTKCTDVMHLLEQRRQVVGLRGGDIISKLQQPTVVADAFVNSCSVYLRSIGQRTKNCLEKTLLLTDYTRPLKVVLQTEYKRQ